jgi:glycine/D-amino acid oxidase-like deaminating enzyme
VTSADVIVIGGGISGAAVALGLLKVGAGNVLVFDEQLPAQRLSRGNFGLTWFMCKGANSPVYAKWCRMAIEQWQELSDELKEETGYDVELEWTGGCVQAFGEEQYQTHEQSIGVLKKVCAEVGLDYPVRMLSRQEFVDMVPGIEVGRDLTGAMYTAEQGHVNPLLLLAAVRCAFQKKGGKYLADHAVLQIVPQSDGTIEVKTSRGDYLCDRLVVAAGHGNNKLLAPLGEKLNYYPQRGQLMVSERYKRVLDIPVLCCRQTPDGTFIIGLSTEDTGLDDSVTMTAMKNQAANAIRLFPTLKKLNWVRSWGAIRVMTPDGAPICSKLARYPNITAIAMHSAVSLAPLNIREVSPWILGQKESELIKHFSNERFNV